jgi:hypothetical protein
MVAHSDAYMMKMKKMNVYYYLLIIKQTLAGMYTVEAGRVWQERMQLQDKRPVFGGGSPRLQVITQSGSEHSCCSFLCCF